MIWNKSLALALSRKVCSWFHFHFHSSRETDELRAVGNAKYGSSSPATRDIHVGQRLREIAEGRRSSLSDSACNGKARKHTRRSCLVALSTSLTLDTHAVHTTCTLERTTDLVSMLGPLSKSVKICAGCMSDPMAEDYAYANRYRESVTCWLQLNFFS